MNSKKNLLKENNNILSVDSTSIENYEKRKRCEGMRNNLKRSIAILLCIMLFFSVILTINNSINEVNAEKIPDNEDKFSEKESSKESLDDLMNEEDDDDVPLREQFHYMGISGVPPEYYNAVKYLYYFDVLKEYELKGYKAPHSPQEIILKPSEILIEDNQTLKLDKNIFGRSREAFKWTDKNEWIEWNFDISKPGLYQIELEYFMSDVDNIPAVRKLEVDKTIPFLEAENITFRKLWADEGEPFINTLGDEMRPTQVEVKRWQREFLSDSYGFYEEPLTFYFEPGTHSIRMIYVEADMVIGDLIIKSAAEIPTYKEIKSIYKDKEYKNAKETIEFQAEIETIEKNDSIIRRETNGDPTCKPVSSIYRKLNVLGGWRWRRGGNQ